MASNFILKSSHDLFHNVFKGDEPAVPPCSSTTTAIWNLFFCMSSRSAVTILLQGYNRRPHKILYHCLRDIFSTAIFLRMSSHIRPGYIVYVLSYDRITGIALFDTRIQNILITTLFIDGNDLVLGTMASSPLSPKANMLWSISFSLFQLRLLLLPVLSLTSSLLLSKDAGQVYLTRPEHD